MNKNVGFLVLRISLAVVFISFSVMQLWSPESWTDYIPNFLIHGILTPNLLVLANAYFEMILGALLLFGLYTSIVSLLLGLHLFFIAWSVGFNPVGIRDFGLAFATLSMFFTGSDYWSLDEYFKRKQSNVVH